MRDHELELIAAFVEGRLEDETEARALLASGPEFREEYEAQKTAYEALSSIGTAALTESERSALHRDVWTELRAPHAAVSAARTPWYYRWLSVAAGLFVVVGIIAVINQSGSSDSVQEAAAPMEADSATDATELASGDDAAEGEVAEEATEGGVAEEAADGADLQAQDLAGAVDTPAEEFYAAEAAKVRSGELSQPLVRSFESESADQMQACVDEAELTGYAVLTLRATPLETEETVDTVPMPTETNPYIIAAPEGDDPASAPLAFVDAVTCEVLYHDR